MESKEIWKDIKGYEGLYRISSKGLVFGVKRNKKITPSMHTNKQGHKSFIISISKNGVKKSFKLNRLVYSIFIGRINGMIDFKDGDYTNCSVDNLIDVNKTFKFKKAHCQKVLDTETMKVYDSCIELSQEIGIENHLVWYGIKNGKEEYKRYKFL